METLNLVDILKDCPKGTKLYSTIFGDVTLHSIDDTDYPIEVFTEHGIKSFSKSGLYYADYNAECLLFPSKDCRDWSEFKAPINVLTTGDHVLWHTINGDEFLGVFYRYTEEGQGVINVFQRDHYYNAVVYIKDLTKVEKFNPKWLKPGDAVLVRDYDNGEWCYALFSHISAGKPCVASCVHWRQCIPYNADTKYLVGKEDDAIEFYHINWE